MEGDDVRGQDRLVVADDVHPRIVLGVDEVVARSRGDHPAPADPTSLARDEDLAHEHVAQRLLVRHRVRLARQRGDAEVRPAAVGGPAVLRDPEALFYYRIDARLLRAVVESQLHHL